MQGQVIKRGKAWQVRVPLGSDPESGTRRYVNRTVHGTKKDAEAVRVALLRQRDLGELLLAPTRVTLREFVEEWKERALRPRVRPGTFEDYEGLLRRYVLPLLGDRRLTTITPLNVQDMIAALVKKGLSPRTIRYCHTVLSNALRQAVRWRYLQHNPAREVDLPKRERREMRAMSHEEVQRFLAAAAYSPHYVLFALLLATGLRPGEAVALKWSDFDGAADRIIVRRAASWGKGGVRLHEPKTSSSRRQVQLPKQQSSLLVRHRGTASDDAFIFPSRAGTPLDVRNLASQYFKPILRAAGLPSEFRLYDLRHTHATLLLLAGEHPKIVSERLGHASVMLTLDTYSHVLPGMQEAAASKLDALLFASMAPGPHAIVN